MTDQPTPPDPHQATAQAEDQRDEPADPTRPTADVVTHERPIVQFGGMGQRVWDVLIRVAGVALAGAVIDGALSGLTFGLLGRWFGVFVLLGLGVTAFLTAMHALGGADRAGRRGERLSSPDVGLAPRKLADGGRLGAQGDRVDTGDDAGADEEGDGPADDGAR